MDTVKAGALVSPKLVKYDGLPQLMRSFPPLSLEVQDSPIVVARVEFQELCPIGSCESIADGELLSAIQTAIEQPSIEDLERQVEEIRSMCSNIIREKKEILEKIEQYLKELEALDEEMDAAKEKVEDLEEHLEILNDASHIKRNRHIEFEPDMAKKMLSLREISSVEEKIKIAKIREFELQLRYNEETKTISSKIKKLEEALRLKSLTLASMNAKLQKKVAELKFARAAIAALPPGI